MRSCSNCCVGTGNWSISRSRNGTGWTRASVLPSVGQPGGPLGTPRKSSSTSDSIQPTWNFQEILSRRILLKTSTQLLSRDQVLLQEL